MSHIYDKIYKKMVDRMSTRVSDIDIKYLQQSLPSNFRLDRKDVNIIMREFEKEGRVTRKGDKIIIKR